MAYTIFLSLSLTHYNNDYDTVCVNNDGTSLYNATGCNNSKCYCTKLCNK